MWHLTLLLAKLYYELVCRERLVLQQYCILKIKSNPISSLQLSNMSSVYSTWLAHVLSIWALEENFSTVE